jgi:hypothetical protein
MRCSHFEAVAIMLAVLAIAVCPCVVAAQSLAAGSGSAEGGASVFFPEKAFEFQAVIDGAKVVHDFVVVNQGSVPLLINEVRTG